MLKKIKNNTEWIGFAFALLAVALWSGNFVVARGLSTSIAPVSLSFYRWLVAVVVFTPFALPSIIKDWQAIKKHFKYLAITALLGISLFNTLIYYAGHTTTAINLSLIALTFPVFIILISSLFFKEKITLIKLAGIIIVLSGVLLIISKGDYSVLLGLTFNTGDPLMLMAAFVFAVHSMLVKNKPKAIKVISFQYMTFLLGLIFLLPFYLQTKEPGLGFEWQSHTIIAILYVGIFSSLFSFVLWNKAIEKIGAPSAGMIYFLMPLFSGFVSWMIIDERLRYYHLISGILIVAGILIANKKRKSS